MPTPATPRRCRPPSATASGCRCRSRTVNAGRLALTNASAVVCGPDAPGPVRRPTWDHLGLRTGVGIGIEDGKVALIAPDADLRDWARDGEIVDADGRLVTPGLVDAHTHAVFGRTRLLEQSRRAKGE